MPARLWAAHFGMSERTFQRALEVLKDEGVVVVHRRSHDCQLALIESIKPTKAQHEAATELCECEVSAMNAQTSRNMTKDIQEVFASLPPNFFGQVEVHFRNGVAGYAKVIATKQFANSKGENPGSHDGSDSNTWK